SATRDGRTALTASEDGTLRVWDVKTAAPLRVLEGHEGGIHAAEIAAEGSGAVSAGADGSLRVWDLSSGVGRTIAHEPTAGGFVAVVISPDGRFVAAASASGALRRFSVADRKELLPELRERGLKPLSLALTFDGS